MNDIANRLSAGLAGRYELVSEAGEGGMALVFRARDLRSGAEVAIKVVRPELSSSLTEARFLREISIAQTYNHPGIVPVLESGNADGLLYLVMPFISGETLAERIERDGPLSVDDALVISAEVGAALAHAHESGVVHRDVKPDNIILGPAGWMIMDFGVARALAFAGGDRLTQSGHYVGTPRYMSPEQCAGDRNIDARADQYSLACVIFEMLLGEPPFTGPTAKAVIARHISETPPSLTIVRPGVPAGIVTAVNRALAKSAADRFPTVTEFIEALSRDSPAASVTGAPPRRRRRALVAGIGAVTAVALAVGAFATWSRPAELDDTRVLVFPPLDATSEGGVSDQVANYIGYVLEGTAPLRWEEARDWAAADTDLARLSQEDRLRLARRARARYFIDGSVIRSADSVTVIQRLFDARNGQLVSRAGASSGSLASEPRLGARAVGNLLVAIIGSGLRVDLGALSERSPAAIANFYQGELAYRRLHFAQALHHYRAAVEADSFFAIAAVKGAQAANWSNDYPAASVLANLAIRHDSLLPVKYRTFIHGVRHFHQGRADSAVLRLSETVTAFPDWAEGHAALAEVYYHLMPEASALDSLARAAFQAALRADSDFSPPLYHLAEMAIRSGDLTAAQSLVQRLRMLSPDQIIDLQLELMIRCAQSGPASIAWTAHADTAAIAVQSAAQAMSSAPALRRCAEAAADATLWDDTAWGALLVLQTLLVVEGRREELLALLRSDRVAGLPAGYLLLLDALVDPLLASAADSVYTALGLNLSRNSPSLWMMLEWAAASGRTADVHALSDVLLERASSGERRDLLIADMATARLALLNGDSQRALELLGRLRPTGTATDLVWNPWEALVPERLLRAQLLLALDSGAAAHRILADPPSHRSVAELLFSPVRERLLAELTPSANR